MGRQKIERACSFKPDFTLFSPEGKNNTGNMELNSDEMEAIYLMDYEGIYQEEAATLMNVSRPTFSRIIKSAHKKIATALIRGYSLHINDTKDKFIVALAAEDAQRLLLPLATASCIALVQLHNQQVQDVRFVKNPLCNSSKENEEELTRFLKTHEVSYWIAPSVSLRLKEALLVRGMFYKKITALHALTAIPEYICKGL
jgi:predicted DNA-binding protein (UPF0251 family)